MFAGPIVFDGFNNTHARLGILYVNPAPWYNDLELLRGGDVGKRPPSRCEVARRPGKALAVVYSGEHSKTCYYCLFLWWVALCC